MTPVFPPLDGPRVFHLAPGADFAARFLDGLSARMEGQPAQTWARTEIWLNTERARRRLQTLLEAGPVRLMPRLRVFTDLAHEGTAPAVAPLRRRLELAQLVRALIAAQPGMAARTATFDLAETLAQLMDEMQAEGVAWAALDRIDTAELSAHWQRSLRFLHLISAYLDQPLTDAGDPQARLRAALLARAAQWTAAPPATPVIVAGSTGSRGATAPFMAAVARLPSGAVVLPGLDATLPPAVWEALGDDREPPVDHPQWGYRRLSRIVGFDPGAVPPWHHGPAPYAARNALVSLALRPAPVTDQWLAEGPALIPTLAAATENLTLVEAPSERVEALTIARILRGALAEGRTAALITPDRALARRVTAAMDRWATAPDDSAGRPLHLTPPGVFLRLVAGLIGTRPTPAALLALLKHPLTASGAGARGPHMAATHSLEMRLLRGGAPHADAATIAAWATATGAVPDGWAGWLCGTLQSLAMTGAAPLADQLARHIRAAEVLAAGPGATGSGGLWSQEAGAAALALVTELRAAADAGGTLDTAEYRALVASLLSGGDVPDAPYTPHPGIAIWGTLEARTQSADLVILGALNEGTWPRLPRPDPWLNREMRRAAGLPLAERQIGLSAHDFQQAMGAPRVILTRATRDAETPTVASRWILRLTNLLSGLGEEGEAGLRAMRQRGDTLIAEARALEEPAAAVPPAPRPAPCPPLAARPARLAATRIEMLVRDPYAIYAQYVLGLRTLDPLGREPDHRERGTASHLVLQRFVAETADGLPPDAATLFDRITREVLEANAPWPAARTLWRARLGALRDWFLATEAARRTHAAPLAQEVRGQTPLTGTPRPFTLAATADRIDRAADGSLAIYDYKGSVPSKDQLVVFSQQLQFEALIAAAGGFPGIPAAPVTWLEMIGLGGGGKTVAIEDAATEIAKARAGLVALIGSYQTATQPYPARTRPERVTFAGDYDHLARRGEWSDGDPFEAEQVP